MLFKSCHHAIILFSCCEMRHEKEELIPGDLNMGNGNSSAQSSGCRVHFPILQKFETLELFFHSLPGTEDCLGSKISQTANKQMQLHLTMLYISQECRKPFQVLALRHTPSIHKLSQVQFPISKCYFPTEKASF